MRKTNFQGPNDKEGMDDEEEGGGVTLRANSMLTGRTISLASKARNCVVNCSINNCVKIKTVKCNVVCIICGAQN